MLLFSGGPFVEDHLVILPRHNTVPEWMLTQLVGVSHLASPVYGLGISVPQQFPVIVVLERHGAHRLPASFF